VHPSASLDIAIDVAPYFDLDPGHAKRILKEVASVTMRWDNEATKLEIKKGEIDRMASAFEHVDLQIAMRL